MRGRPFEQLSILWLKGSATHYGHRPLSLKVPNVKFYSMLGFRH